MVDLVSVLLFSFAAGLVGAVTGLGGSSIATPVLVLLGVPIKEAVAAGIVSVIATSSGSASLYVREGLVNTRAAMFLEPFTIVGGMVGASVTVLIDPRLVAVVFAAVILFSMITLKMIGNRRVGDVKQDRCSEWLGLKGSYFDQSPGKDVSYRLSNAFLGGLGMSAAGFFAGMLGIGAGAFKVAIHELVLKMPPKVSTTTSNFIIGMTALAGSSIYFSSGLIVVDLAAPLAVGTSLGAFIGSRLLRSMSERASRIAYFATASLSVLLMLVRVFRG